MSYTFSGGHGQVELVTQNPFVVLAAEAMVSGNPEMARGANAAYAAHKSGVGANIVPTAKSVSHYVANGKQPGGRAGGIG